jgi:hypothetical protein
MRKLRKQPYSVVLTYPGYYGERCTWYDWVDATSPKDAGRRAKLKFFKDSEIDEEFRVFREGMGVEVELVLPGHVVAMDIESEEQY